MFKKTTIALAGVLGIVAAATLSTTAGAADTDAALVNNVKLYTGEAFTGASQEATAGACQSVAIGQGAEPAKSAELINQEPDTSLKVQLFSELGCDQGFLTELNMLNPKDPGLTWIPATAKSFRLTPAP